MTRLTALLMQDPDAFASAYGPDAAGKFGAYIGGYSESPSGFKRARDLLNSDPIYDTAQQAQEAAESILKQAREFDIGKVAE